MLTKTQMKLKEKGLLNNNKIKSGVISSLKEGRKWIAVTFKISNKNLTRSMTKYPMPIHINNKMKTEHKIIMNKI